MKNIITHLKFWLLFSNLCLIVGVAWPYQWPVAPFSGPHPISATMGEWRNDPNPHLHAGVDIGRGAGTNVYPSVTGSIPNPQRQSPEDPLSADIYKNSYYFKVENLEVGNFDYVHIVPNQTIIDWLKTNEGQDYPVIVGSTLLGTIQEISASHLHFEENDGASNPLRIEGLDNYVDTARTYVSTLEFFRKGTDIQLTDKIYGQTDILSRAWDAQSNGSANVSVYKIGYQVKNSQGNIVLGPLYNLRFDSVTGGSRGWVYANFETRQSNLSAYYYYVTNTQTENRYWNTKLKTGEQWNGVDAKLNSEATYPDGKYEVSTLAFDIRENGGDLVTQEGAITVETEIDNFRPYLKKAEIIRDSDDETKYSKEWTLYEDNLTYGPGIDKALGNDNYTIKFEFSEPVVSPTLSIDTLDDLILSSDEPVGNQKNFKTILTINDNFPIEDGEYIMTVNAVDLAGNNLLALNQDQTTINPVTQLTRNAEGTMQGIGGSDTSVVFKIDRTSPTITYLNLQETPHFTCEDEDNCGAPENPKHILWTPSKFTIEDISGVTALNIYKDNFGELYYSETLEDIENINRTFTFIEGSTYTMVATDTLEQSTTMYFIVDAFRPYAKKVTIKNKDTQETAYEAEWLIEGTSLILNKTANEILQPETEYTINILFSEPINAAIAQVEDYEENIALSPISDKIYTGDFYTPSDSIYSERVLKIESYDLANEGNLKVNTGVTEIDIAQIARDATGAMRGQTGIDESHSIIIGEDNIPPTITWYDPYWAEGTLTGANTLETAPWFVSRTTQIFQISDENSGLKFFELYEGPENMLSIEFPTNVNYASLYPRIPENKAGYKVKVIDQMTNATIMHFHIDRAEPKINFENISAYPSGDYFGTSVYGTITDETSGIGEGVYKLLNATAPLTEYVNYEGPTYPEGEKTQYFSFSGLTGGINANSYLFIGTDRSNQIGTKELWLSNQDKTARLDFPQYNNIGLWTAASGMRIKNASLIITGNTIEENMPEECSLLNEPEGMAISVKAVQRGETYPGEIYWDNIPLNLSYAALINKELLYYDDYIGLIDTSNNVYMTQLTSITVTQTGNTNAVDYECAGSTEIYTMPPGSILYKGTVTVNMAWTDIISPEIIEEEWVPAGFNIALHFEKVDILVERVLKGGKISFARAMHNPDIPGQKLAEGNWVYDVSVAAEYEGLIELNFHVDMSNFTSEQIAQMSIYHKEGGNWVKLAAEIGDNIISCKIQYTSPFAIMIPMNDYIAPQTYMETTGAMYVTAQGIYLSANNSIILNAEDITDGTSEISGVATTYYLIDNEPTQQCLSTPFEPYAMAGTCANPIYTLPFTLSEGMHSLYYFSVDHRDNYETGKSTTIYIDGTAPQTTLIAKGSAIESGGTAYITATDSITLTAIDPVVNGVASGMDDISFLIDKTMEECEDIIEDDNAPQGTCENPGYTLPFTLSAGAHTVYYLSEDNVGNEEEVKSANIEVIIPKIAIWSGLAGDGNWHNPDNWRDNEIPGANDNAVLATRDTVYVSSNSPVLVVYDLVLGDEEGLSAPILMISTGVISTGKWTIHKNAILIQNTLEPLKIGNLSLLAGGKIEHKANSNIKESIINLEITNNFIMEAGSGITVTGLGYMGGTSGADGFGPGGGIGEYYGGSGGGHGG
ncbi:hypothetical protein KJ656_14575, partial [bacterium]|nr:hypothetical protein [bacterium]